MSGGYVFCEYDSIQEDFPKFQQVMAALETRAIKETGAWIHPDTGAIITAAQAKSAGVQKPDGSWSPLVFGGLTPEPGQYGRTTILPALFEDINGANMSTWRQHFVAANAGHQTLITGTAAADTIPEDFKVAWIGLELPNKEQAITELKWQIGDRKYGRVNIEELRGYNKPAIVFEEGFILNEEESFHLYGYIEDAPQVGGHGLQYQRIVMLGFALYRVKSKVLGLPGATPIA